MQLRVKSLSDQIYDILKAEILRSEIPFGSKLVNRELQERFGVSSSPVRDAVNRLYQDGLILAIDNSGATVIELDYEFFLEINEVLLYIVKSGMDLAFDKAKLEDVVTNLEKYISLQEENIDSDKYYEFDYRYHKVFLDFSENSRLQKLFEDYNVLHEMLVRYPYNLNTNSKKDNINIHKKIVDAYKKKDINLAMELVKDHYRSAEDIYKHILEKGIIKKESIEGKG